MAEIVNPSLIAVPVQASVPLANCQDYGFFELFFRLFSLIFTRSTPSLSNDFILYDTNELLCSPSFPSFLMFPFHSGISRTKENKKTIDSGTTGTGWL